MPRELIKIAFNVTISRINEGFEKTQLMHEAEKDPMAKQALDTSLERFNKFDLNNIDAILTSLKVWLNDTITFKERCLGAFHNRDWPQHVGDPVSCHDLAIITKLSKTLSKMHVTKSNAAIARCLLTNIDNLSVLVHEEKGS
ncbi:hypothetical protein Fmac_001237 [Flemingia macrophylla]|uniref:Uncharacterized protein n=1 Tax=Flemingia macrophylla TaxID=520843 RepID=A0ABD1NHS5_9FABA